MSSSETSDMDEEQPVAERYREAAELALEQLEWVIRFFYRLRKSSIAEVLEQNRRTIVSAMDFDAPWTPTANGFGLASASDRTTRSSAMSTPAGVVLVLTTRSEHGGLRSD